MCSLHLRFYLFCLFLLVAPTCLASGLFECHQGTTIVFTDVTQGYQHCHQLEVVHSKSPSGHHSVKPALNSVTVPKSHPVAKPKPVVSTSPATWEPVPIVFLKKILGSVADVWVPQSVSATPPVSEPPRTHPVLKILKSSAPQIGHVYRIPLPNGVIEYTNIPPTRGDASAEVVLSYIKGCYACSLHSKVNWDSVPLNLTEYAGAIKAAAASTGVSAALIRAVIHAESDFNPLSVSNKGAKGLMQLMPGTASSMGVANVFSPSENIAGGTRYLAHLVQRFQGKLPLVLAGYNAGENAVISHGGVPPYPETEVYVHRVGLLYQRYKAALSSP